MQEEFLPKGVLVYLKVFGLFSSIERSKLYVCYQLFLVLAVILNYLYIIFEVGFGYDTTTHFVYLTESKENLE